MNPRAKNRNQAIGFDVGQVRIFVESLRAHYAGEVLLLTRWPSLQLARYLKGRGVDVMPVFQTRYGKVGILICYDRQLPETRKSYEEWAAEKIKAVVPLNRWQSPEDVADMVVFLTQ